MIHKVRHQLGCPHLHRRKWVARSDGFWTDRLGHVYRMTVCCCVGMGGRCLSKSELILHKTNWNGSRISVCFQAIYVSPYSFKWEIPPNVLSVENQKLKKKKKAKWQWLFKSKNISQAVVWNSVGPGAICLNDHTCSEALAGLQGCIHWLDLVFVRGSACPLLQWLSAPAPVLWDSTFSSFLPGYKHGLNLHFVSL